jgi:hypothetical protein
MKICYSIENMGVHFTGGIYMFGQLEHAIVKGQDEKIRLEDLNQLVRNRILDVTQQKLTRVEVA